LTVSAVAVANVSSVWAEDATEDATEGATTVSISHTTSPANGTSIYAHQDDYDYVYICDDASPFDDSNITKPESLPETKVFSVTGNGNSITNTSKTIAGYSYNTAKLDAGSNGGTYFTFTANEAGIVVFDWYENNASLNLTVTEKDNSSNTASQATGSSKEAIQTTITVPSAGTYEVSAPKKNIYLGAIAFKSNSSKNYPGTLTVTSSGQGETTITVDDTTKTSPVTLNGGEKVVVTANPSDGYIAVIKDSNGAEQANPCSFTANGDKTLSVSYILNIERTPITESIKYDPANDGETADSYVLPAGEYATAEYYFKLTNGATLSAQKRININKGDKDSNSIVFSTGDLGDKTAKMTIEYQASGSNGDRFLVVNDKQVGAQASDSEKQTTTVDLASNTEYYIASNNSGLYITLIDITVTEDTPADTSKFTYAGSVLDGTDLYVIGKVASSDLDSLEAVGFGLAKSEANAANEADFSTTTVYDKVTVGNKEFAESGYYFTGYKITDVSNGTVWAAAFSNDGTTNVFANAVNATAAE
jgi:hypothetical protein